MDIVVDLTDPGGNVETFEYTLNRHELDEIAEPFYARAINLCKNALREASLVAADIDKLVLVGGATL
ncbi:Hsp70 family protein, partial [Kibdelosporangium lantanae]